MPKEQTEQLELPVLGPTSKYRFEDTPDGFIIHRDENQSVRIMYHEASLRLANGDDQFTESFGLFDRRLGEAVATRFTEFTHRGRINKSTRQQSNDMIARALATRLKVAIARICNEIAPREVVDLQRKMFASTQTHCAVLSYPALYTDEFKYLRADLMNYNACRMFVKQYEVVQFEALVAWRKTLTTACSNKAMQKTIDHFPVGVSFHSIGYLINAIVERPVTTRLHMIALLSLCEHHNRVRHMRAVANASDAEVIKAVRAYSDTVINKNVKHQVLAGLLSPIFDYDQDYNGDLEGLARRSREWHGQQQRNGLAIGRNRWRYDLWTDDKPTKVPEGVDLDKLHEQGITLLDSANAVIREGTLMDHCVGGYAQKAVNGECYLFHVERTSDEGTTEMATVEISPSGRVRQSYGPRDTHNSASRYGKAALDAVFPKGQEDGYSVANGWFTQRQAQFYELVARPPIVADLPVEFPRIEPINLDLRFEWLQPGQIQWGNVTTYNVGVDPAAPPTNEGDDNGQ